MATQAYRMFAIVHCVYTEPRKYRTSDNYGMLSMKIEMFPAIQRDKQYFGDLNLFAEESPLIDYFLIFHLKNKRRCM